MRLNNATGAEKDLKHAVALDSTNYWYRYMLAGLYGMTGRTVLTTDMYESLLKDFPKKGDLYYSLANLYINQQQYDKALSTIRDIETQFGKSDGTVMTKFNILRQQNKNEEAFKELEEYNKEYSSPQVLSILGDYEWACTTTRQHWPTITKRCLSTEVAPLPFSARRKHIGSQENIRSISRPWMILWQTGLPRPRERQTTCKPLSDRQIQDS